MKDFFKKIGSWCKAAYNVLFKWVRTDGLLHFAMSAIIVFALGWVRPVGIAVVVALVVGVAKEVFDYIRSRKRGVSHDWDNTWHDLVCDVWGVVLGFALVWINLLSR